MYENRVSLSKPGTPRVPLSGEVVVLGDCLAILTFQCTGYLALVFALFDSLSLIVLFFTTTDTER